MVCYGSCFPPQIFSYRMVHPHTPWVSPGARLGRSFRSQESDQKLFDLLEDWLSRFQLFFLEGRPWPADVTTWSWRRKSNLPSGKLRVCYWKWPFIVDLVIKNGDVSIVMLVCQRVPIYLRSGFKQFTLWGTPWYPKTKSRKMSNNMVILVCLSTSHGAKIGTTIWRLTTPTNYPWIYMGTHAWPKIIQVVLFQVETNGVFWIAQLRCRFVEFHGCWMIPHYRLWQYFANKSQ